MFSSFVCAMFTVYPLLVICLCNAYCLAFCFCLAFYPLLDGVMFSFLFVCVCVYCLSITGFWFV